MLAAVHLGVLKLSLIASNDFHLLVPVLPVDQFDFCLIYTSVVSGRHGTGNHVLEWVLVVGVEELFWFLDLGGD